MTDGALLSPNGRYRFLLWRRLSDSPLKCLFVMLNPSTADASTDDPTIRRCRGFAELWGCGELVVANLFAWRATEPDELLGLRAAVATGHSNDDVLTIAAHAVQPLGFVVCAWGAHKSAATRALEVREMFAAQGVPLFHLKGAEEGCDAPHPLYLPKTRTPAPYPWGAHGQ